MHYFQIVSIDPAPVIVHDGPSHRVKTCDALLPVTEGFATYDAALTALDSYVRNDVDFTVYAIVVTHGKFPIRFPY